MSKPADTKTDPTERKNSESRESKLARINSLKAEIGAMMSSPEAKERQRWREEQRKYLREMELSPESIEDEILI